MRLFTGVPLLAMLLASALEATTITFSPARPAVGDLVTVTVRGVWSSSCVPETLTTTIVARRLLLEGRATSVGLCHSVFTNYTISSTFRAPNESGLYDVEYTTVEIGRRVLDTVTTLPVTNGGCQFEHALTVDANSVYVGDPFRLEWCDPSQATNTVKYYRVYSARSPNGPFTSVIDLPAGTTSFTPTNLTAGTTYYYVQASRCAGSGDCSQSSDAVLQSNIVRVDISPLNGCLASGAALCLGNGRFSVSARWKTSNGENGNGHAVPLSKDSGYFWFFDPANTEVTVKVLDACQSSAPRFWFFAAGMTNVEVELTVRDQKNHFEQKTYRNALGNPFGTILDTNAFASCP